jgi:hypothetical protein
MSAIYPSLRSLPLCEKAIVTIAPSQSNVFASIEPHAVASLEAFCQNIFLSAEVVMVHNERRDSREVIDK